VVTIRVTDLSRDVDEFLGQAPTEQGDDVAGSRPDLVLTPDTSTAAFWSRPLVPVYNDEYDEPLDLPGLLALVGQLLDIGGRSGGGMAVAVFRDDGRAYLDWRGRPPPGSVLTLPNTNQANDRRCGPWPGAGAGRIVRDRATGDVRAFN
jgi:hypothetical protein